MDRPELSPCAMDELLPSMFEELGLLAFRVFGSCHGILSRSAQPGAREQRSGLGLFFVRRINALGSPVGRPSVSQLGR